MSITDELRKYTKHYSVAGSKKDTMLSSIADRIDAEHEKAIHELNGLAEDSVLLPKDADGEPIRIGDKVTEHEDGLTFKVDGFMDWDGEWWMLMRDGIQAPASKCTHYREPTVEDVLREFALACEDAGNAGPDVERLAAEYAKRLKLAEEDE